MQKNAHGKELFTNYLSVLVITIFLLVTPVLLSSSLIGSKVKVEASGSLDGSLNIEEIAASTFIGQSMGDIKGRLGNAMGHADINGDGYMDLYLSAPSIVGVPGKLNSGRCYIWYGSQAVPAGDIDLDTSSPDVMIRGNSLDSQVVGMIDTGDIDRDGYTDMVLGNSLQPESGKVYLLWGSSEGWPSVIDLYPIASDMPNAYPVGFRNTNTEVIISGEVTTAVLGTHLGQNVIVSDIDNDEYDDLVFSFHGWNAVMIVWGRSDRLSVGNDLTYIKEDTESSQFGKDVAIGDIDGDGYKDLAVSSPIIDDDTRSKTQCGAVSIYFNISGLKGSGVVGSNNGLRPRIWGKDSYDRFGASLVLEDINDDGKDDIIVGAPGGDGPSNGRIDCGQLYIFYGDDITAYPQEFVGEDLAEKMVHGKTAKNGDEPGDQFGQIIAIGDIDNDGGPELAAGYPSTDMGNDENIGRVELYETRDFLTFPGTTNDLSNVNERMRIYGNDPYDNLGFNLDSFDLNGDMIDDIVISAPSADGPQNSKAECGEVYFLPGSSLRVRDLTISGAGYEDETIFSGLGNIRFDISLLASIGAENIHTVKVHLDPDLLNITFELNDLGIMKRNDQFDLLEINSQVSGMTKTVNRCDVVIDINTTLLMFTSNEPSILVEFNTTGGETVSRTFPSLFTTARNLELSGPLRISRGGLDHYSVSDWFTPGDSLGFFGPKVVYSHDNDVEYPGEGLSLYIDDGSDRVTTPALTDWVLEKEITARTSEEFTIGISIDENIIPSVFPLDRLPDTGPERRSDLKIDDRAPRNVSGLVSVPDMDIETPYDDDTSWGVKWNEEIGSALDDGSGVKEFQVSTDGENWISSAREGGLWATYYHGRDFNKEVAIISGVDGPVDHPVSEWGSFSPDPNYLINDNYSVRWHGWFRPITTKDHRFSLSGQGEVMMIIDGQVLIDWTDLATNPVANPISLAQGVRYEVAIYFKCREVSSISFRLEDTRGFMIPVSETQLLYPSNFTVVDVGTAEKVSISVRSVDWVSLISVPVSTGGTIDLTSPGFDLSMISGWYPVNDPRIQFKIFDPPMTDVPGSGLNTSAVEYRLKNRDSADFTNWMSVDDIDILEEGVHGPTSIRATAKLTLTDDWRGILQMRAVDMVGNIATSSLIDIGVDKTGPRFEVMEPNLLVVQEEGQITIIVKATDRPGSGVNGSTLEFRYQDPSGVFTDWMIMGSLGVKEEITASAEVTLAKGVYNLQFRAFDAVSNMGISELLELQVVKKIIDQKPVPVISSPLEGEEFQDGTPIVLDAEGSTDDGIGRYDHLVFTWWSNISGRLGSGKKIQIYIDQIGMHRITLYVDDGTPGHNVSTFVNITINEFRQGRVDPIVNDTDEEDPLIPILLASTGIVLILVLIMVAVVLRYKKRKEDEIKIEYKERTEDDNLYETRLEEEERSLGLGEVENNKSPQDLEEERKELYG